MKSTIDVSVVIPTRNRINSLNRTLGSISNQSCFLREIIIVDSSDVKLTKCQLTHRFEESNLQIIHSKPSVCEQRNIGIEKCTSKYTFLCDDDIEVSEYYIANLVNYLISNNTSKIVSGLIFEQRLGLWCYAEAKKSFLKLFYTHVFGLSVWSEVTATDYSENKFIQYFINYYLKKGNRIAKSGWPIVINYEYPSFKTSIYGLGAAVFESETLKKVPFETSFYENGIGDNYDLAIGLNSPIIVLKSAEALHHKESTNRVSQEKSYFYRVSALHFILKKHKQFGKKNIIYFIWSLIGNSIKFLIKGKIKLLFYNFELIFRIIFNFPLYKSKN